MSYAITALHLESPTFTVGKAGSLHSPMWYGTCGICTDRTTLRRLLGVVLGDMGRAGRDQTGNSAQEGRSVTILRSASGALAVALVVLLGGCASSGKPSDNKDPRKGRVTTEWSNCATGSCLWSWKVCIGPDLIALESAMPRLLRVRSRGVWLRRVRLRPVRGA